MAREFLGLSLFIMLLSFFIILNAMSKFEDVKSQPVLRSLDMAFSSGKMDRKQEAPTTIEYQELAHKEGSTIDKLEALFNAHIRSLDVTKNRLGTEMNVRMSRTEFEAALDGAERVVLGMAARDEPFLSTLITLVQSEDLGTPYRMDISYHLGENPSVLRNAQPEVLREVSRRVAGYALRLEAAGLPQRFFSGGMGAYDKDMIEIAFVPYFPVQIATGTLSARREAETP
ncbi:MAG: hypothetical protein ACK4VI_01770 [Alphaproteobacteria bacterium]